ncbi:PfkB family carbohydrate kinase [Aeromonas jandaei]
MFKHERRIRINELIQNSGKVSVFELSVFFNVSHETIRSDLRWLTKNSNIIRYHGGACSCRQLQCNINNIDVSQNEICGSSRTLHPYIGRVFVLGAFNIDIISVSNTLPKPGESLIAKYSSIKVGGKGANQATAANAICNCVFFACKIGKDHLAQYAKQYFNTCGVNFVYFESDFEKTGYALVLVSDDDGENMVVISRGANCDFSKDNVNSLKKIIFESDVVLLQLEINISAVKTVIDIAKSRGCKIILNAAPYTSELVNFVSNVNILTANKIDAFKLTGIEIKSISDACNALRILKLMGVDIPIITMGSDGVVYLENDVAFHLPCYPAVAIDTTGAGDAFNGALAAATSAGVELQKSIKLASSYASLSVERLGASNMPSLHQATLRMENNNIQPTKI